MLICAGHTAKQEKPKSKKDPVKFNISLATFQQIPNFTGSTSKEGSRKKYQFSAFS